MKKNFLTLISIAFIIIFICIYYVKFHEADKAISLEAAFETTGANIYESEIYVWATVEDKINSIEDFDPIINSVLNGLNISTSSLTQRVFVDNNSEKKEIKGEISTNHEVIINAQIDKDSISDKSKYLTIVAIEKNSCSGLEETEKKLIEILKKDELNVKVNTSIKGYFNGKVDYSKLDETSKAVLKKLDARKIENVENANYISVSAYSPYIQNYVSVNGKKINLNVAMRYNSYEDRTYIWMATPVITTEY